MDPFHWINDSAFGKKGTQDLVVKTKYVSKDGALERNLQFTRMNYYIEGEQRFVVQYLGDPSTALRHEGQGFGPPDSDSSPNDLIPRWQAHMSEHGNEPISGDAPATTDEVDKVAAAPEYTLSANPTKELSPVPSLQAQLDALMAANDQEHNELVRERMRPAVPIQVWNPHAAVMSLKYAKEYLDKVIQAGIGIENARKCAIVDPQGGQVYVLATRDLQTGQVMQRWQSHILVDGLRWKQHYGKNDAFVESDLQRLAYSQVGNRYFHKWVFFDSQRQHAIIHYMGEASEAVGAPHGNDKTTNRSYIRTSKILEVDVDEQLKLGKKHATEIFNALTGNAPAGEIRAITAPRNPRQVQHILDMKKKNNCTR